MMDLAVLFHAPRFSDETRGQYRNRRKYQKAHLRQGIFAFISARILSLPPKGVDDQVDTAIRQGRIRKVQEIDRFDEMGRLFRVGVEKGTTFMRPGGRDAYRDAARTAKRAARRAA